MGVGCRKLWLTNTGDESGKVYLSTFIPVKEENRYYWPPNTPIGFDIWVNNTIDLKEEEGPVCVEVIKADNDTGIWLICADEYFGGEKWLYNFKPKYTDDSPTKYGWRIDHAYNEKMADENPENDSLGLHISPLFEMKSGEGPWPVTFVRTTSEEIDRKIKENHDNWLKSVREKYKIRKKKTFKDWLKRFNKSKKEKQNE